MSEQLEESARPMREQTKPHVVAVNTSLFFGVAMLTEKQVKLAKNILSALPSNLKPRFEKEIKELKETEKIYACLGKWARQAFNTRLGDGNDSISFCAGYMCDE